MTERSLRGGNDITGAGRSAFIPNEPSVRRRWLVAIVKRAGMLLVPLTVAAALGARSSSPGGVSAPRVSPVPGTEAFVEHHTISPVYVGEYIGKLKMVAGACEGSSGAGGTGPWDV